MAQTMANKRSLWAGMREANRWTSSLVSGPTAPGFCTAFAWQRRLFRRTLAFFASPRGWRRTPGSPPRPLARAHDSQPDSTAKVFRGFLASACRSTVARGIAPATPANHATQSRIGANGIHRRRTEVEVFGIPIAAPFPHVPEHVRETPLIHRFLTNLLRSAASVGNVPAVVCDLLSIVAPWIGRGGPCPTGIFPFRLGRQAIRPAGIQFLREPRQATTELYCVIPRHANHRGVVVALRIWFFLHHATPLAVCHGKRADEKRLRKSDTVRGFVCHTFGIAHEEIAAVAHHESHVDGVASDHWR